MKHVLFKRALAAWLAVLLGSVMALSGAAEQEDPYARILAFPPAYDAQLMQNVLYVLLEDELAAFAPGQEEPATILALSEHPEVNGYAALLFSDNAALYLLDTLTGMVYQVDGTALKQVVTLDLSVLEQGDADHLQKIAFECPIIQNGSLYLLCTDLISYSKTIHCFSMESGERSRIFGNENSFQEIIPYRDGRILGLDADTRTLIAMEADTGKAVEAVGAPSGYGVGAVAYDPVSDRVYSLCDAELVWWNNGRPITVGYLPVEAVSDAIYVGIWEDRYIFVDGTGAYACDMRSEAAQIKPLTICSEVDGLLNAKLLSNFMQLYPQTPVIVRGIDDEDPMERISTVNMTRDTSVDLFAVTSKRADHATLFSRSYAAGLDSQTLKDDVLSMYPQIRDYLMRDGALFGYPAELWAQYWTVNPELLQEAQPGTIPQSLDEYYDRMLLWYEDHHGSLPTVGFDSNQTVQEQWREAIYLLSSQYICAYANDDGPLSFNTPAFRGMLEKVASLSEWKGTETMRSDRMAARKSLFDTGSMDPFTQSLNPEMQGNRYILPPAFAKEGQPALDTTLVYFVANPYSENQAAAVRFLEFFSQNMELVLKYKLHPAYNELVERQEYPSVVQAHKDAVAAIQNRMAAADEAFLPGLREELAQEEANFARQKENRWEYAAEVIAEYRRLAPYMSIEHSRLIWELHDSLNLEAILMKYFEGQAALDQVLSELDRKAALWFLEAQ